MHQDVFIIGSKSMAAYGGYETFVSKLTECHSENDKITYHIACKANGEGSLNESALENAQIINDSEFIYNNARCFKITVPDIGAVQALYYDIASLIHCCKYIKKHGVENAVVYILACRIGILAWYFRRRIHKLGGKIYINPDGHEWMRRKWSPPIRLYWKLSEKLMVKNCDLAVCDSKNIEEYIRHSYSSYKPDTVYIAYGADTVKSLLPDSSTKLKAWYEARGLQSKTYYLIVGRFVPENNYETIIREFMVSGSLKDLVIITNENKKFLNRLENKLHFSRDSRIKFSGTVYDRDLLKKIRENAYAYLHGHEAGGTNPSLLESMAATDMNLLLDVSFNRETAEESALYWNKDAGQLASLIDRVENMSRDERLSYSGKAKKRIQSSYSWELIAKRYEELFLSGELS